MEPSPFFLTIGHTEKWDFAQSIIYLALIDSHAQDNYKELGGLKSSFYGVNIHLRTSGKSMGWGEHDKCHLKKK